jgi:hypothetical protein
MTDDRSEQHDPERPPSQRIDSDIWNVAPDDEAAGDGEPPRGDRIGDRIQDLAESAFHETESFEAPSSPPDEEQALELLREGFGPTVWVYVQAHVGDRDRRFNRAELALLQRAMNDWLELYARCYGVELDAAFTVREAAELLVETRNVVETAQLLTRVPER